MTDTTKKKEKELALALYYRYGGIKKIEIYNHLISKWYDVCYKNLCNWLPKTKVIHTKNYTWYEW